MHCDNRQNDLRHRHVIHTPFGSRECWQGAAPGWALELVEQAMEPGSAASQSTPAGDREYAAEMIYSDSNRDSDYESLVSGPPQLRRPDTIGSQVAII